MLSPPVGNNDKVWSLSFYRDFNDWELAASYSLLHFIQTRIPRGGGYDRLCWDLMEVESSIFDLFIIRFKMQLLPLSLGRAFGKPRFLKGWLFSRGQQLMVRFLPWITLCFMVALWQIVVVYVVVMWNLWITCYFFVR